MKEEEKFNAFEQCLGKMQAGIELEQVLENYPQWADEFRPMLQAAQAARRWDVELEVPTGARLRSRQQFLDAAHERGESGFNLFPFLSLRTAALALVLVIGLILFTASGVAVSARALPGEALYPVKRFTERTQLLLVDNPAGKVELEKNFDRERVEEVNALIGRSRSASVSFVGLLTSMGSGEWVVDGISVLLSSDTRLKGEIETGIYVGVSGILQDDGTVLADRIWDREFEITGQVSGLDSGRLLIDGVTIDLIPITDIQGALVSGSRVKVQAVLTQDGQLQAHVIEVLELPAGYLDAGTVAPLLITPPPEDKLDQGDEGTAPILSDDDDDVSDEDAEADDDAMDGGDASDDDGGDDEGGGDDDNGSDEDASSDGTDSDNGTQGDDGDDGEGAGDDGGNDGDNDGDDGDDGGDDGDDGGDDGDDGEGDGDDGRDDDDGGDDDD